ncbi:hypothetical protein ASPZODRAFT_137442 [Penicilliopsis zonata CBS 506.65]|uniref:GAF domain-containing protein n=1 Tax=Penicilliopsis zonata CBS 506.65 TaxID=1073090 RepID=A0A1L9S4T0_9EURO|nr:hypothetical protein ASPZODRAFT_137442 [Penicilliopsis zonata CBS 506.65]OJJ42165.1 hypothetical protein ASPZODRAFT_137442 [Penicilliopsis zonata CBS 506.65]
MTPDVPPSQLATDILAAASQLATLGQDDALDEFWPALSGALNVAFPHTSCTVLAYHRPSQTLLRLYSSRPDVHAAGGRKRVRDGTVWKRTVLDAGDILVGSTRDDIRALFPEYENLWAHGLESILNIPVRRDGVTIGSVNLMNREHAFDDADKALAMLFAQLAVAPLEKMSRDMDQVPMGEVQYV